MEGVAVAGVPWGWTIVGTALAARVLLFYPTLKSMQSAARIQPYQEDIKKARDAMEAARQKGDMMSVQEATMRMQIIYEKANVSMPTMLLSSVIQVPVALVLCDLPLLQLKTAGLLWFTDLTIPDPTWGLPAMATALIFTQIGLSKRDAASAMSPHAMNALQLLSLVSVVFMQQLPAGSALAVLVGVVGTIIQTAILRMPAVRRRVGLPIVSKKTQHPSMLQSAVYYKNRLQARIAEVERR
ncbi:60Kd inner membrane protein-domain-containing protein [Epithele typhae]|uniref:60Kd inner membrane protein-domain-containing protein n=1 Tax=Epithele typhae TaxID=378194 RepID=UPI002008D73F|nr:60Kd inner membrane protein-domain-containing protein [Epithele typhae]KAH9931612.1 60Kd inner membrane protein-domain-containing protein [Epithele typhae]